MHTEYRWAARPGRARPRRAGHRGHRRRPRASAPAPTRGARRATSSGAATTPAPPDDLATPGYGVRARVRPRLRLPLRPDQAGHRRHQRPGRRRRARAGLLLRPALRGGRRQAHDRPRQARPAGRVRPVVAAPPPHRPGPGQRPAAVEPRRSWPRRPRRWAWSTRSSPADELLAHTYAYARDAGHHASSPASLAATKRQIVRSTCTAASATRSRTPAVRLDADDGRARLRRRRRRPHEKRPPDFD